MSILELQNIDAYYGAIHSLKDLSIKIPQGKIVTIIGANGAGKSTTLRIISGLIPPRVGQVLFQGENINSMSVENRVKKGIVHVPEGRGIFANLSVEENLKLGSFFRKDHKKIKEEEENVLGLFPRLKERLWQNAGTLSGGEQQMLAIARALMAQPKILLLDEPSLGLAPLIIESIFEIIQKINKLGTSILLVEQNALLALEVSHYGIVLETGKKTFEEDSIKLLESKAIKEAYLGH